MSHVADLTVYEMQRVRAIARWKGEVPGRVSRALHNIRRPLGRLGATLIPENITRKALDSLEAKLDTDRQVQEVLREAQVGSVREMSRQPLDECARLAKHFAVRDERRAMLMGAAAGAGGVVTEVAGIPLLLAAALRSIHRTGLCYGYRLEAESDRRYLLGVLELSTVDDPVRRLQVRRQLTRMEQGAEDEGEPPIALAGIERGLTADLALEVVPIVGDAVTILLDFSMMKRVNRTARRVFEERWLRDAAKIDGEIAPAPQHPRDDALRTLGDLAGHAVYLTSFGVSFGVTVPFALAGQAARWLPGPVGRGARDGARDAVRSVNQIRAGRRRHDDQVPALVSVQAASTW